MNKTVVAIICTFVSLIAGYHLYPVLNELQLDSPTNIAGNSVPTQSHQHKKTIPLHQSNPKAKALAISKQKIYDKDEDNNFKQEQVDAALIAQNEGDSVETTFDNPEQLAELQAWSVSHKKKLEELLSNNLPIERAEKFMDYIVKDNPFLNDATVKQDINSDEQWSYRMTQTINNLVLQDPYGPDIEIISLTCKQLTCEMVIRELVIGSWFEVYPSLLRYFISNQYIIQTEGMKQFRFQNGEEYLYYQHLIFAK